MRKTLLAAILLTGCITGSYAQTDTTKKTEVDQYIGVQLNGLIRQVFNFNNSNTTTTTNVNPYLLTYSINSRKTGWGLRAGIGYSYNSSSTNDGTTSQDIKINSLQARLGVEKAFKLDNKWTTGAGLDFVINLDDNHTTTSDLGSGFSNSTDDHTVTSGYGGGPQAWLRYNMTKRILIGTEASFYYTSVSTKETLIENGFQGNPIPDVKSGFGTFSSPVVFYLIVKF